MAFFYCLICLIFTMEEKKSYMPVKEYAMKKGCSIQHVYNLIKRGELNYKKIGTYTLVEV